jgi:hypothetical protein
MWSTVTRCALCCAEAETLLGTSRGNLTTADGCCEPQGATAGKNTLWETGLIGGVKALLTLWMLSVPGQRGLAVD